MRRTVVCKARVAVKPDVPSTKEDTEMAGNIGVEVESDLKSPSSLNEGTVEEIAESVEVDIDEHMDEDRLSDVQGETGEECLEASDRGSSETVIPDSFDDVEEERIRGRSWPA